jgi:hypothetical protein
MASLNITLDHCVIATTDFARADAFYAKVLEAEVSAPRAKIHCYRIGMHNLIKEPAQFAGCQLYTGFTSWILDAAAQDHDLLEASLVLQKPASSPVRDATGQSPGRYGRRKRI